MLTPESQNLMEQSMRLERARKANEGATAEGGWARPPAQGDGVAMQPPGVPAGAPDLVRAQRLEHLPEGGAWVSHSGGG